MYHPAPMTRRTTENGDADGRGGSARRARRLVQKAEGVVATIVNGQVTLENGKPTGRLPGVLLRGPGTAR